MKSIYDSQLFPLDYVNASVGHGAVGKSELGKICENKFKTLQQITFFRIPGGIVNVNFYINMLCVTYLTWSSTKEKRYFLPKIFYSSSLKNFKIFKDTKYFEFDYYVHTKFKENA